MKRTTQNSSLEQKINKKIGLSDVKVEWLNKRALVLISIFSHAANKSGGNIIDLRADNVLCQISSLARTSNNAELIDIYQRIKREIKVSLCESNSSREAAQEVSKLAVYDDCAEKQDPRLSVSLIS